jgi:GT2 family glycosyltransferase
MNSSGRLKVNYITLNYNSGFSGGCNIGAASAIKDGCKYLFLSNNDLVFDKFAIEELYKLAESNRNLVCIGPLLMLHSEKNPDIIQEFGGKINFKKGTLEKYYTVKNINDVTLPETLDTDFVGGGVCFIDADLFKNTGMYETSYFGYFDEIDLSYRLKVQNKYKMMVTSKAKIWHNHSSAGKNKLSYYLEYYLSERNKFLYYHKYRLYKSMVLMILADLTKFPWRLVWFMKVCDFKLGLYYLKGMLDGLINKKGKPSFIG